MRLPPAPLLKNRGGGKIRRLRGLRKWEGEQGKVNGESENCWAMRLRAVAKERGRAQEQKSKKMNFVMRYHVENQGKILSCGRIRRNQIHHRTSNLKVYRNVSMNLRYVKNGKFSRAPQENYDEKCISSNNCVHGDKAGHDSFPCSFKAQNSIWISLEKNGYPSRTRWIGRSECIAVEERIDGSHRLKKVPKDTHKN